MAAHSALHPRRVRRCSSSTSSPTGWRWPRRSARTPIDFSDGDPVEQIMDATDGLGADCGVEAVGYQAHDPTGEEHPELVLDNLVKVVRTTGGIGVVGVYVPEDPGAADRGRQGGPDRLRLRHVLHQGPAHGHRPGAGEALQPAAARPDHRGPGDPSFLVSHELGLDEAPDAYDKFDKRGDGWTKVLLHPAA